MMTPPPVLRPRRPTAVDVPTLTATQQKVHALVSVRPGVTIRELATLMGVSHATTTYHLGVLVRKGVLVRHRDGREVKHFLSSASTVDQFVQALLRDDRKRRIVEFLADREVALSINKMALQLGLPFGYLKRTLLQLQGQGLVALPSVCMRYYVEVRPELRSMVANLSGIRIELTEAPAVTPDARQNRLPPAL